MMLNNSTGYGIGLEHKTSPSLSVMPADVLPLPQWVICLAVVEIKAELPIPTPQWLGIGHNGPMALSLPGLCLHHAWPAGPHILHLAMDDTTEHTRMGGRRAVIRPPTRSGRLDNPTCWIGAPARVEGSFYPLFLFYLLFFSPSLFRPSCGTMGPSESVEGEALIVFWAFQIHTTIVTKD